MKSMAAVKINYFYKFLLFCFGGLLIFFAIDKFVFAQNVQVPESTEIKPACFGPWQNTPGCVATGGISADQCFQHLLEGQTTFIRHTHVCEVSPTCKYYVQTRGNDYCPPLTESMSLTTGQSGEPGSFSVTWSLAGEWQGDDLPKCKLSGKDPEKGNFTEDDTLNGSRNFSFAKRGIYPFTFTCNGIVDNKNSLRTGPVSKTVNVFVGNIPPPPAVDLKADPAVIKKGETTTLSWTSQNAFSLSINQGIGVIAPSGSKKVSPTITTRYILTASGEFPELGLARKSVTVQVLVPPPTPAATGTPIEVPPDVTPPPPKVEEAPKIDLKVNGSDGPITMAVPANFNLSWNLDKYCLAYGSWLGIKTKAGTESRTEKNPGIYTYKLYCPTIGFDEVTVRVTGSSGASAVPLPVARAGASLDGKTFSQSIRVIRGQPVDIRLGTAYGVNQNKKVSSDALGGWGLMADGGRCEWNIDLNQGTPIFDVSINNPPNPESCNIQLGKLTFFDKLGLYRYGVLRLVQGDGKVSNIGYINVAVDEPPLPKGPPVIDLRINNLSGPAVTLGAPAEYNISWDVQNADVCQASDSWGGEKFPSGSQHFVSSEKKEFNYTLTCIGKLGTTTKSINLKVSELPVCDFSALPLTLSKSVFDQQSVLSWKCQFANSCEIFPAVGQVETFGSTRVSPKNTAIYTLTCRNLEGSSSFDQVIEVQ